MSSMYDALASAENRAEKAEAKLAEGLRRAKEWLAVKTSHDAWCEVKGRCYYCDPLRDVIDALEGREE